MKLIKLFLVMLLTACGGDGSGLPSQGDGGGNTFIPIISLQVTPAIAVVPIGLKQQYFAAALLDDGTVVDVTDNPAVSWRSSNTSVATIDNKGLAAGVASGTVTITASGTANGQQFSATAELTVTNATVTALQVAPATASVPVGLEQQYTATVFLSDGSSLDVTNDAALSWSSSDPGIATISSIGSNNKGLATGVVPGMVTITASGTANGQQFSATAELTVTNATVTTLQVAPATASVPVGLEQQYTATVFLSDGSSLDVTNDAALSWSSSDPGIATISSIGRNNKGLATGVVPGMVTITASGTANGQQFSATAELTVTNAAMIDLQITPLSVSVATGQTMQLIATAIYSDSTTADVSNTVSWLPGDVSTITVTPTGLLTGVKVGATDVVASQDGIVSNTVPVSVVGVFSSVSANGFNFPVNAGFPSTGFIGAEFTLNVSGIASDYNWSSNSTWATVDNYGKVSFSSRGNSSPVTITAMPISGGAPLSYMFTVTTWFHNDSTMRAWSDAATWCSTQNWDLPTRAELTKGTNIRTVGALWSEWGDMSIYLGSGFNFSSWTSEVAISPAYYIVYLNNGFVNYYSASDIYVVCREGI